MTERGSVTGERTVALPVNTATPGSGMVEIPLSDDDGIVAIGVSYAAAIAWVIGRSDDIAGKQLAAGSYGTFRDANAVREIPVVDREGKLYIRSLAGGPTAAGLSYWLIRGREEYD